MALCYEIVEQCFRERNIIITTINKSIVGIENFIALRKKLSVYIWNDSPVPLESIAPTLPISAPGARRLEMYLLLKQTAFSYIAVSQLSGNCCAIGTNLGIFVGQ